MAEPFVWYVTLTLSDVVCVSSECCDGKSLSTLIIVTALHWCVDERH